MKWACIQKYFDNGDTFASVESVDNNAIPTSKTTSRYDLYVDIFDTKEGAEQFKAETLEA